VITRTLKRVGLVYVTYHALVGVGFVVWQGPAALLDVVVVPLLYPVLLPAVAVCGNPHTECATGVGRMIQLVVLVVTVILCLVGLWALVSEATGALPHQKRFDE
jgi:hypothetical protein